jgi:hypothetical protein
MAVESLDVTIFDSVLRIDFEPKGYCEPLFRFMNRCAWPEVETIRATLESWYAEFPLHHRKDVRNRIRSGDDFNYNSAIFELVLYTTLRRLGCGVDVHPFTPTGERRPDFWVGGTQPFFLEAAVASDESTQQRSANQRMNAVYDALNQLRSPDFFIGLELHGSPATPPSSRALRNFLTERLALLDYAALRTAFEHSGDIECAPRWRFEHAGWVIDFFPIPKSPETRGDSDVRPVGAFLEEATWRVGCAAFRNTLRKKAGKYGQLGAPFVIAVNAIDHAEDIDVKDALFGQECIEVAVSEHGTRERQARMRNGIWWGPRGPRNTRVSAVLAVFGLNHSNVAKVGVRLYNNPWAARPYSGPLSRFSQLALVGDRMVDLPGISLGEILGLPSNWPHVADGQD